jgi:hypothetical protein
MGYRCSHTSSSSVSSALRLTQTPRSVSTLSFLLSNTVHRLRRPQDLPNFVLLNVKGIPAVWKQRRARKSLKFDHLVQTSFDTITFATQMKNESIVKGLNGNFNLTSAFERCDVQQKPIIFATKLSFVELEDSTRQRNTLTTWLQ